MNLVGMQAAAAVGDFDLDAYCARIGYTGPRAATHSALAALVEHHALALPFENADVLLGRPIPLDVPSLQAKMIGSRRGGYCFEHNLLLAGVLRQMGFDVATHLGRNLWRVPAGVILPRTHMVLTVSLDRERFVVDGGYGGVGLTSPLRLDGSRTQSSLFEEQRVAAAPAGYVVQARIGGDWQDLYAFTDEAVPFVDFEVANWYTATHPQSRFRQNLIVCFTTREARSVLFNRELTTYGHASKETRFIGTPGELLEVLSSRLGVDLPPGTRFEALQPLWEPA